MAVEYCRERGWSDTSGRHRVRGMSCLFHNPSVWHGHMQSTRRRHQHRRLGRSDRHRCLPRRASTVRRRTQPRSPCMASVRGPSLVHQVAADRVIVCWRPVHTVGDVTGPVHTLSDVTASAGDVTVDACSPSIPLDWQTAAAGRHASVREAVVPRRWDVTWYLCRRSSRHVTERVPQTRRGWTFSLLSALQNCSVWRTVCWAKCGTVVSNSKTRTTLLLT